jgi:putative selenium metabolism hydrolase
MTQNEKINQFIKTHSQSLHNFLGKLIQIKSPSAGEKEAAKITAEQMRSLGYSSVRTDSVGNVLGELGQGEKILLLSAHLDTAGVASAGAWSFEPYGGKIIDGKICGRGAGDNKGALAAMLYAAKIWQELFPKADYKVIVAGTVLEEDADGYGMQALLEELPSKPSLVMIGKPTAGAIHRGHRGRMEVRIVVNGESCHASTPEKGKNALYAAAHTLLSLEKLAGQLPEDAFLGKASLAATMLEVQPGKFNLVPGKVIICVDRRLTAGETKESALEGIKTALNNPQIEVSCLVYNNKAWTGKTIELEKYFPSWVIPENHPAIKAALEAGNLALGKKLKVSKWTVSTDGVGSMGRHSIPTLGYGPGERRAVDDHLTLEELNDALKFYALFCYTAGKGL